MKTVEEELDKILVFMGIPVDKISNETSFADDYNFDESQFTCLALYLGVFFRINVKESEYSEIATVGGTISFVKKKLEHM